ncbi:MAG: 7-cyano-7-deazaguanine synthase [Ignavibacteria bacterium]|nr:7-cyano-7-deazaguanine synthase [Ignavibacteria bacterium]
MICVLHSGGIDSTAVIQYYLNLNKIVQPLFIDYGQISAKTEFKYSQKIANYFKINKPFFVNLRKFRDINPDHSLFSGKDRGNFHDSFKNQFFPNRNLLLLTIGSVYCKATTSIKLQ